jgi:signal transduction histidine kinase
LVVITGYTDLIDMDIQDPEIKSYIGGVRQAIGRMEDLLAGVLRVERVRATPAELYERINLNRMANEVLTHVAPFADQKVITLDNAIDHDSFPTVEGDALLIKQAMENYLTNAIKYTPEGGRVLVQTQVADASYYFMVKDTGVGIAQHELPFVFEAFYRARHNGPEVKGEGLGLSLVKQAITQHRGDVWVESVIGGGSTFGFRIPLS